VSVGVFNNTTGGTGLSTSSAWRRRDACGVFDRRPTIADKKEGVGEFRVKAGTQLGSISLVPATPDL
jgi:hypothetical protein